MDTTENLPLSMVMESLQVQTKSPVLETLANRSWHSLFGTPIGIIVAGKAFLLPRILSFECAVSWLKNVAENSSFGREGVVHTVVALRDAA